MSVIIRLQNLPWSANAFDIRQYFHGLSIPEGGVHIVGGEMGDAFIAFSTDEDARQAMLIDGGKIKEVKIKLYLSSRSEMQKVIETARAQSLQPYLQLQAAQIPATSITHQSATLQPQAATITPQASSIQPPIATIQPQVATIQPHIPATVTQIQTAPTQIQTTVTQIPPTTTQSTPAMPPLTQIPIPEKPIEAKDPPLPPLPPSAPPSSIEHTVTTEPSTTTAENEKNDQDTESQTSKGNKRSRKGHSRSRSKNRSNSRDRSKSRERSKSRDRSRSRDRSYRSRYKDRRRRDRSRSRDRRSRRRNKDRSRSRDRSRRRSRDRKRDSDRGDRNSIENNNNTKTATVAENKSESPLLATPTTSTKPGFSSAGWVSVGSADKAGPLPPKPIGFSIVKQTPGSQPPQNQMAHTGTAPQIVQTNISSHVPQSNINQQMPHSNIPQIPPLPPQAQLPQPQIPTSTPLQNTSAQQLILPHPPPFPAMALDPSGFAKSNDQNMPFMPLAFPQGPPHMLTPQQNVFLAPNQSQFPQKEPPRPINPNQFQMWPTMRQPMDPSLLSAHGMLNAMPQTSGNMNVVFNRPPIMPPPNEKFQQPYSQPDPRLQSGINTQHRLPGQDRPFTQNSYNNSNMHNQVNFPAREYDNPNAILFNSCVEIRNMSMNTTSIDILRFFQGLHISKDGVKIVTDKKGNKVGIAYVRFNQSYFKDMALKRSGQMLKNSSVEVLHIDDAIFDKATDFTSNADGNFYQEQNNPNDQQNESYDHFIGEDENSEIFTDLVIHEVPHNARDKDIYNLFKGFKIIDAFVLSGAKSFTGFIRFKTAEDARRALANSSRLSIGYTHVKLAICYEHEFAEARDRKNMEENDEEMMDSKDNTYDHHETRDGHESERYPPHGSAQGRSDPRQSQAARRGHAPKALLPTPPSMSFDPRVNHTNPNFPHRVDRQHQEKYPRGPRENFHEGAFGNEDSRSRFASENSHFQQRPHTREDYPKRNTSQEDFRKRLHNELYETQETREEMPPPKLAAPSEQLGKSPINTHKTPQTNTGKRIESTGNKKIKEETKCVITNDKPELLIDQPINSNKNPFIDIKPPISNDRNQRGHQLDNIDSSQETLEHKAIDMMGQTSHDSVSTDCLVLQGLPYNATDRDILDFFSDVGLAPTKIHIMLNKNGQPAGDAFCEFNTTEEVARALTKNRNLMGRSSVSVLAVPREEMMGTLNPLDTPHPEQEESYHSPTETYNPGNRFPRMPSQPYPPHFPHRGRGRGAFRGSGRPPHPAPPETDMTSQNVKAFGKPGCVVALENVPFRAEVEDIINFFKDFFVPRDNIIRRFDEVGRATGDARVCLSSPLEAQRVLRSLNGRRIFNREIYLSLVP